MKGVKIAEIPNIPIDPVTLDIIEGALKNARFEMDAVLYRTAMSPVIREQHDEFPMLTDPQGRTIVGQFGSYISEMMESFEQGIDPGDVILTRDPYQCGGAFCPWIPSAARTWNQKGSSHPHPHFFCALSEISVRSSTMIWSCNRMSSSSFWT
jgi:hypothetical protein